MDAQHHGAAVPSLVAPNGALKVESQRGANELEFRGQETTNSANCVATAAAAAREADEFIATLTSTVVPAGVKHAIVLAACHDVITPNGARWLLQILGLVHA